MAKFAAEGRHNDEHYYGEQDQPLVLVLKHSPYSAGVPKVGEIEQAWDDHNGFAEREIC